MKKDRVELSPLGHLPGKRSNSSGNLLAKRLYRNNSLTKLAPLMNTTSVLGSLNTSLIPSVSLRKLHKMDTSQPSIQISHGKILIRKSEDVPWMTQQGSLMKKGAHRKFQKIDSITEKSILPEDLKADVSSIQVSNISQDNPQKFKPNRKWLAKLKQGRELVQEKLTPQDFIQLIEEEGGLGNEFCYLQKGDHPYDLQIVEFANAKGGQYITISARGVTYFNWQGSRFVTLDEWKRQAYLFNKLMSLEFFGKYKLHKNFSNWKKYSRKTAMNKTRDKLQSELLVEDKFLREALLQTRGYCCRLETDTNYCSFDDAIPALPFNKFKLAQQNFLNDKFQTRISEVQEEIKCDVATCLGISMREFKEINKISSSKEGKGIPLLNGDEKNLDMPYTKEATLRVQQQKFKRFLKLVDILVVHSKINMMDYATLSTARKLQQENQNYQDYLKTKTEKKRKDDPHFKGKQYIECQLQIQEIEERAVLRPSQEELTTLMEDVVSRSTMKLIKNHRRIINDPDIIAILYEGAEQQSKEPEPSNILKTILGAEEKQEAMVNILNKAIETSYIFLQNYASTLSPLIVQLFRNQNQLSKISEMTSQDFFNIRESIETWRKELHEVSKLSDQYESAVFLLNFKSVKQITIQCTNLCIAKTKEVVPKILEAALQNIELELRQSLRLMEIVPIGIEVYISFQNNKNSITNKFDQFDERLGEIGQLIEILKDLGGSGEHVVIRGHKQRKQLGQMMKALKSKVEEAEMHNKVHESNAQQEVKRMVPKVFMNLQTLYTNTKQPRLPTSSMVKQIQEWQDQYFQIHKEFSKLQEYQRFLGMQRLQEQIILKFSQFFQTYKHIWTFKLDIEKYHDTFMISSWKNLQTDEVKTYLEHFLEESENIKKNILKYKSADSYQIQYIDQNIVSSAVMDIKKKIRPVLDAIQCLRDPSLEERQQKAIRSQFENKNKKRLAELVGEGEGTVIDLLKGGLVQELDFLKKIVFKSKKQLQLNLKMATVSRFWGQSMGHSSKGLIDNFAQHYWTIASEIDEKITVINCVREDPEVQEGEFRMRVENEKNLLDSLRQLLTEWEKHHNYLSYFQPIFSNPYWKGTTEYKAYTYAESNWKKLIKQISKDFSLRKLATQEKKHFTILRQNNTIFEQLKHSVELFLNAKREAFPKLYFLSNEQLLHLLLQDKDYSSIDKHLSRIFPHLKSLDLNEERNCPLAVRNMANECLTLRTLPPKQVLQLQEGLRAIEERMKEAIKSGLLKCSNYYIQDDFKLRQWINENILQVLLFIENAEFTKLLQYDYLIPQGDDMNQLLSYQMTQIKELHSFIKEELANNSVSNFKHQVLLMQFGHFRDIVLRLMQLHVRDQSSFDWQKEVRSYYNGGEVAVTKYLTKAVEYGFEFVCPTYSYAISSLSERHFIQLANTAGLQYLPVLVEKGEMVSHFCISNAKNYVSVSLQPKLSVSFLHNLCQGTLASNTFLQIKEAQYMNQQLASLISSFIHEAKCLLDRRQLFNLPNAGKNLNSPSFDIALRMDSSRDFKPIQQYLKVNYRIVSIPEISISTYVSFVCDKLFFSNEKEDFPYRVEKGCEIVNKCCGYKAIGLQKIRSVILASITPDFKEFKDKIVTGILTEMGSEICQPQQFKVYESILREVIQQNKVQEEVISKPKHEKDSKNLMNTVVDVFDKKQLCVLVGPNYTGKKHLILETYKTSGLGPVEIYYTDLITFEELFGRFENELWKEGIFEKHLKRISCSQEEWFVFEGSFGVITEHLIKSIVQGFLLLENGQLLYLSPNWKFLISTDILQKGISLPDTCEIIYSSTFISEEYQLQHSLETIVRPYFKTNIEGFSILTNLCLNNFQKIMKFRVKGRFLKTQHLQQNFINIIESVISKCPEKNLEAKDNQIGLEKLFLWCIYWTIYSSLPIDHAKKFQNQLFQQIKLQIDRSLPLNISKFQFDNPSGSLRRIETSVVTIKNTPYYLDSEREAIYKFIELYLSKNRHILIVGDGTCGKTEFLTYLKQNLGEELHSFLMIKISKHMSGDKFSQLLYRKAKIGANANKQKYLSAINGKKLIIMLDDINLLDQNSIIGRFIRSILTQGYYFDHITLQKIFLNNVSIIACENSSYEFSLSYDVVKNFKPIYLPPLSLRDIAERYENQLKSQFAVNLCRNVAALHEFITIGRQFDSVYENKTISSAIRILQTLRNYNGKENLVHIWEYISIKEYVDAFPEEEAQKTKIIVQLKNYSNLLLKNNQDWKYPLSDHEIILTTLHLSFSWLSADPQWQDYYIYFILKIKLTKSINLFTIHEPLCPSIKLNILESICKRYQLDLIHPYRIHEISANSYSGSKLVVYVSDQDEHFQEMLEFLMVEVKENIMFAVDFSSNQQWKYYVQKYPSLLNSGSRYYKRSHGKSQQQTEKPEFQAQIQDYCSLLKQEGAVISAYEQQELIKIIPKHHQNLVRKCSAQTQKLSKLLDNAEVIKQTAVEMKSTLSIHLGELQKIARQEETFRKELLNLKNTYEDQQTEAEKSIRDTKIQSIQFKLNELMAMKRSGEDQHRARQDQYISQQKILKTVTVAIKSVQEQYQIYKILTDNSKRYATFLSIIDFYYSKEDQSKIRAVQKSSRSLELKFQQLMKCIYDSQVSIYERSEILWLLNDKSILIQDDTQAFIDKIQKKYQNCQIIKDTKDLEDIIDFDPKTSYIFVGQLRSQINYLNDLSNISNEKYSRDKNRLKDQSKQKDEKYIKDAKDDKPNYSKNIYFVYKDKQMEKQIKDIRSSHESLENPMRASRNLTQNIRGEDSLGGGRRADRKVTKLMTIVNPMMSMLSSVKPTTSAPKQKFFMNINHEMILKIKYKQLKEGQNYQKYDNELQDLLKIDIANEEFHSGGKKIIKATDKSQMRIPLITLICRTTLPQTQRQNIRHSYLHKQVNESNLIEQLLETVEPFLTGIMKNEQRQLEKFKQNKNNLEKIVLQKIRQSTPRSLNDLATKDGAFQITLAENIKNFQDKYTASQQKRSQPYIRYFQQALSLWNYLSKLSQVYPTFRMAKKEFKDLIIKCMVVNKGLNQRGEGIQEKQKINIGQSKQVLMKQIIGYIVVSLSYRKSLFALCLLAILQESRKGDTSSEYVQLFAKIMKEKVPSEIILQTLNHKNCSKNLLNLLELYAKNSEDYFNKCQAYLKEALQLDIVNQYESIKSQWADLQYSFIAISLPGASPYWRLAESKKAYFIKENSECVKCPEVMLDRGLNKLILVNFIKEESYAKIMSLFEEWPKENNLMVVSLFTSDQIYKKCLFKEKIRDQRVVEIEQRKTPSLEVKAVLQRNLPESSESSFGKIIRTVLFNDLRNYFKQKAEDIQVRTSNSCFYDSDFITNLISEVSAKNAKDLLQIISKTIYINKEKSISRDSKKWFKKQDSTDVNKVLLGDSSTGFQESYEYQYFMTAKVNDLLERISTTEGCYQFARSLLTVEERRTLTKNIFNCWVKTEPAQQIIDQDVEIDQSHWQFLNNLTFESFKNLESMKFKRQSDIFKNYIRKENSKHYLIYRWIQHSIKSIKEINRKAILSKETKSILQKLKSNEKVWCLNQSATKCLSDMQQKIRFFEEAYHNNSHLKRLQLQHWSNYDKVINLYLYSSLRKVDLCKAQVFCKVMSQKDEKNEKAWLLDEIQLKNCKYDTTKHCLELNDRHQNKKIQNILIVLNEKEPIQGPSFSLPLFFKGQQVFKIDLICKFKEEGLPNREKIVGMIKYSQNKEKDEVI